MEIKHYSKEQTLLEQLFYSISTQATISPGLLSMKKKNPKVMITFLWHSNNPYLSNRNVHLILFFNMPKTLSKKKHWNLRKNIGKLSTKLFNCEASLLFHFFIPISKHRRHFPHWSDYYSHLDCSFFFS